MKNFLEYYYNFLNITVHEKDKMYYFYYNNNLYTFVRMNRSREEVLVISRMNLVNYNKIISNIRGEVITFYNNIPYVLIRILYSNKTLNTYPKNNSNIFITKDMSVLMRNNWYLLITKKIDYLEYQREHLKNKDKILLTSLDYYIGMAENSVSYFNSAVKSVKPTDIDRLVVAHRRIYSLNYNNYYDPLSVVIDHESRDISEYLKYIFLKDKYDINILKKFFNNLNLSYYGYLLLYSRMLYPSFYFDCYENIVNNNRNVKEIVKIIKRSDEYEEYLNTIYKLINSKIKIPKVDWV